MGTQISVQEGISEARSMQEIRHRTNELAKLLQDVMKNGTHYGTIPGAGPKLVLLKAGAEKILSMFRLSPEVIVEENRTTESITYRVRCRLISPGGVFCGEGIGESSTDETKFAWRAALCQEEYDATPEYLRRTTFKKNGGGTIQIQQIHTVPQDQANTVLKMAKKRALVDACLTCTAASDIFTQDIELDEDATENSDPTIMKPRPKEQAPPAGDTQTASGVVKNTASKPTAKGGTRYGICINDIWYNTFDSAIADMCPKGASVTIQFTTGQYGNDITDVQV